MATLVEIQWNRSHFCLNVSTIKYYCKITFYYPSPVINKKSVRGKLIAQSKIKILRVARLSLLVNSLWTNIDDSHILFRTKKFHFRNTNFLANITASLSIAYVNSNVMPKHAPGELRKSTLCYKYSANNVNNRLLLVSVSSVTQRNPFTLRSNILFRVVSYAIARIECEGPNCWKISNSLCNKYEKLLFCV